MDISRSSHSTPRNDTNPLTLRALPDADSPISLPSFVTARWLGGSLFLSLCPGTDSGDTQYNCFGPNFRKVLGPALSTNPQSFFFPSSIRVYAHFCPLQLALNSTWHHSLWWISSSTHGQATGFVQYSHNYTGLFFFPSPDAPSTGVLPAYQV